MKKVKSTLSVGKRIIFVVTLYDNVFSGRF